MTGPARRRPFPFDLILNGAGLMLGRSKKGGDLIGQKADDMSNVAPTDYDYSSLPPSFGRVQPYREFPAGYGLAVQEQFRDLACHYCENADTSAGPWIKGPDITRYTPPWPEPPWAAETDEELVAAGNAWPSNYSGTLAHPNVKRGTLHVNWSEDNGGATIPHEAIDNSFGVLVEQNWVDDLGVTHAGRANVGTIDYATGAWTLTQIAVSALAARIAADYTRAAGAIVPAEPVTHFFTLGVKTYALAGRYVFRCDVASPPTWAISKDLGAGKRAIDGIVFHTNAGGGAECLYVAVEDTASGSEEALWRYDGAAPWQQRVLVQTLTLDGDPSGGTFTLSHGADTTAAIAWDASAATVQTALRALTGLSGVEVTREAGPPIVFTIVFTGYGGGTGLLGTNHMFRTQVIAIAGTPTGGHYHLTFNGNTTGEIAWNDTAPTIQAALRLLPGLGSVVVWLNGGVAPDVSFSVAFTGLTIPEQLMTVTNSLTGTGDETVAVTYYGDASAMAVATTQERLTARAFALVGREFYRSPNSNLLAKCDTDADPWYEANWGAANQFYVADKSAWIIRLAVTPTGALLIYKGDGIYTLGPGGEYYALYPQLRFTPDPDNGKPHTAWLNDEYVVFGNGLWRIGSDFNLAGVGTERLVSNNSPVRGTISALCGHDTHNLYAALHNRDSGNSYLLKFGAWVRQQNAAEASRIEGWHGSISEALPGVKVTAMDKSDQGAPSGHHWLYLGFSDGTIGFLVLPCTPNPAACAQYRFNTRPSYVYGARATFLFEADQKAVQAVTVENLNASTSTYAQFEYRSESGGEYLALGRDFTQPIQYSELPLGTGAIWLDWRLVLVSTDAAKTPQIAGIGIHHAVRPLVRMIYEFLVLAVDGLRRRDGTPLRLTAKQIRDTVKASAARVGSSTVYLPDEESKELLVTKYGEAQSWNQQAGQWQASLAVTAAEFKINTPYGTFRRLRVYTFREAKGYTFRQVQNL